MSQNDAAASMDLILKETKRARHLSPVWYEKMTHVQAQEMLANVNKNNAITRQRSEDK